MNKSIALVIALCFCLVQNLSARQPDQKTVDVITAKKLAKHIEILASDKFEGRLPGTRGEQLTVDYISGQFKQVGLKPGADGDYLEPIVLLGNRPTSRPELDFVKQGTRINLEFGEQFIVTSTREQAKLEINSVDAVFVGYGMQANGRDDYKGVDVLGKAVFFLWGDPPESTGEEASLKPRTAAGMRQTKYQLAMQKGAVAAFAIHNAKAAGYPWEVLGKTEPQWVYRLENGNQTPDFSGMISSAAAGLVFTGSKEGYQALADRAWSLDFVPESFPAAMSLSFDQENKRIESNNVVGMLPSGSPSSEYVLYSAHWDHMGLSGNGDDKIMNGAVDNASGVSAILTIAEAFSSAQEQLRRNVIFFATSAEEQGLLGAYAYAADPVYPLESTLAVINIDSIFPFGRGGGMTVTGFGNSELEDYLRVSAELEGRVLSPESTPEFGAFFRSDHFPFVVKGVPALFAVGGPTEEEWMTNEELQKKYQDFGQNVYHKAADEYDPDSWDMGGIVQDVKIHFRTGYSVATDTRRPNWYFDSEFRTMRDQQWWPQ